MSNYELTLLLDEEKELDEIKKLLESTKAKIKQEDKLGKKTLSYPIKKKRDAYFFTLMFEIEEKDTLELKKKLDFSEKLLRYLLIKQDK